MIRIAIDAMGGDHAPQAVVAGVNQAIDAFMDIEIQLYGDPSQIKKYLTAQERVEIIATSQVIEGEDEPVKAVRHKKDASMVVAARAVKEGQADALLSAGNTGALLTAGLLVVGRMKGIERPGLMPIIPTINPESPQFILMDAGANAQSKPVYLHQYAILANHYCQTVLQIKQPRIALLNNGTEMSKGDDLRKEAYGLLSQERKIHFIGNIEAKDLLNGQADIVITDGFTGNADLKTLEGTAKGIFKLLKQTLKAGNFKTKLGALLLKGQLKKMAYNFDDTRQGGAVLLGVNHPVIKAHGSANDQAIYHAIEQARMMVLARTIDRMRHAFQQAD